jgi:formylglycine-generating enzyme required for sulfatase activity
MLQCPPQSWQAAYEAQRLADDPHGNPAIERLNKKPLPAFRLQATTVTRRQYRVFDAALESSDVGDFVGDPISGEFAQRSSVFKPGQSNDDFPVICVNWFDAWVFAKWLGPRFRLPKESEWELACRAGTQTAYHFGDGLNGEQANCDGNFPNGTDRNGQPMKKGPCLGRTTPVGDPRYPCNAWGFWDVHGNVWEWCEEPYEENADPGDPESVRVLRGGSWYYTAYVCVGSNRLRGTPGARRHNSGFRLRVD